MVAAEKTYLPQSLGGTVQDYGANFAKERTAEAQLQQQHPLVAAKPDKDKAAILLADRIR